MVPDVAKVGHSFQGAFAYYLRDKRENSAAQHPKTAERVAWTETRNVGTDDPEAAKHKMIATARSAAELKAAAGIKPTGRKSTACVYAYSLAWHPSEAAQLDRAEMVRAAEATLKVLGAEAHQALIVCHTDRGHPHVHVIVNRVDPRTGKMLSTSNDHRKLSAWAHDYEKARGKLLTPARAERARQAAWGQENHPDSKARRDHVKARDERKKAAAETRQEAVATRATAGEAIKTPADLRDLADAQEARHADAWESLHQEDKDKRAAILAKFEGPIEGVLDQQRHEARSVWAAHFRDERARWREFERLDRSWGGALALSFSAARERVAAGRTDRQGFFSLVWDYWRAPALRRAHYAEAASRDRLALAKLLKARCDRALAPLKKARAAALAEQRTAFTAAAEKLRAAQAVARMEERAKMGAAWRQVYAIAGKAPRHLARRFPRAVARDWSQAATPPAQAPAASVKARAAAGFDRHKAGQARIARDRDLDRGR